MKALKLLGLLLILSLVGLGSPGSISKPRGMEITVCPQGPPKCDFAKIQEAIDAAPEGATIRIGEGAYLENLTIRKSLRLIGVGQDKVFLRQALGAAFWIEAAKDPIQIWIEGLSLGESIRPNFPPKRVFGIFIMGQVQAFLRRLTISGYVTGIMIMGEFRREDFTLRRPQAIIQEVTISHNFSGISTGYPIHIWRITIIDNEVGIEGREFLLEESTITKKIDSLAFGPSYPTNGKNRVL